MEIQKNISFFIEQQFPAIYREDGQELVALVEDYYRFLETQENQSTYVSRRFFEYKDIDTTLKEMIIFFKRKFLDDLPLKENTIRFIVKNILDLYRRKGTSAGIELFFAIFFKEFDIQITYPADQMLKISNSVWRRGVYLQMIPNDNRFLSKTDKEYTYSDLISRNIEGTASGAKAAVSKVMFIYINGIKTPIIYIDSVQGTFQKYDDIISNVNNEVVSFGRIAGSLSAIDIDEQGEGTTGNNIGDIYNVISQYGDSGRAIVTEVSTNISGEIEYTLVDGGYGYTIENTRLLVSDQTIIIDNQAEDFIIYETLRDTAGNEGIVIGQNKNTIGVKMNGADRFDESRNIRTVDRFDEDNNDINIDVEFISLAPYNNSSPGDLYPDTSDIEDVIVAELTNISQAEIIPDLIAPFLAVPLNSSNFNTIPPATATMSGSADPVTLATPIDEAFDIQVVSIGRIKRFANINPGSLYVNEVFARAEDSVIKNFKRKNQIIRFVDPGDVGTLNVGEVIKEQTTNIEGRIAVVNSQSGYISVTPFSFDGFSGAYDVERLNGDVLEIAGISTDYNSNSLGDNAIVDAETEFAIGRIKKVAIENSGFGYVSNTACTLQDDDEIVHASGITICDTQGVGKGYWSDFSSHINGYVQDPSKFSDPIIPTANFVRQIDKTISGFTTTPATFADWAQTEASDGFDYGDINRDGVIDEDDILAWIRLSVNAGTEDETTRWNDIIVPSLKEQFWYIEYDDLYDYVPVLNYYSSNKVVQDSDFYQEYSYQIKSKLALEQYEELLRSSVHLAGTKMFGDFLYKREVKGGTKARFLRKFNDDGRGSVLDTPDIDALEASVTNLTVDTVEVTADHEPI